MKFKLVREENGSWKVHDSAAGIPANAEVKEVETDELLKDPRGWAFTDFCEAVLRARYRHVVVSNESDLSDVAWNLGEREYAKELTCDAEGLRADILSRDIEDSDALYERMNDLCDNTVMYTRHCYEIIQHTDNIEHGFDEGLIHYDRENPNALITGIAYWAYYADLMDRLGEMDDIDLNADKLGRCEECDGKGYELDANDVIRPCGECDKYDSREAAADAAIAGGDVKRCLRCHNKGYTMTGVRGRPEACTVCTSLDDDEACALAVEDGVDMLEEDDA